MIENFLRRPRTPGDFAADAMRVAGVLSVLAAAIWWSPTDAGVLAFALPGVFVPRFVGVRPWFDITFSITLLVAAWSNVFDLYTRIGWWDLAIHFVCTGVVAAMLLLVVVRWGVIGDPGADKMRPAPVILLTILFGLALSAVWEMIEWAGHAFISDEIFVAYDDTIADMAVGGLGSLCAGILVASVRLLRPVEDDG